MKPSFPATSEARKQLYILKSFGFIKEFLGYGSYGTRENFEKFSKTFFLDYLTACRKMRTELDQHFHHSSASIQIMLAQGLIQIIKEGILDIDEKKIIKEIDRHNKIVMERLKAEVNENKKENKIKNAKREKVKTSVSDRNNKSTASTFKVISENEAKQFLEAGMPIVSLDIDYINKDYLTTYFNCIDTATTAFADTIAPFMELYSQNKIPTSTPIKIEFPMAELTKAIAATLDTSSVDAEMEKRINNMPKATRLDKYQSAILFHYLKEQKVIINYDASTLAKLIHFLTGHSANTLRTEAIGRIHDIQIEDLKGTKGHNLIVVKNLLENIITEMNKFIQKHNLGD